MKEKILLVMLATAVLLLSCSRNSEKQLVYTGVIEATTIQVPALTGGKIETLLVDTGDQIEKGQLIAKIDTLELSFQKQKLQGALEEIRAQEQLTTTKLKQTKSDLEYMRKKFRRFQKLLESSSVNQQTVDDLKNRLEKSESAFKTAKQQFATFAARKKQLEAQFQSLKKKIRDAQITSPIAGIVSDKYFEAGEAVPPLNPVVEVIDLAEVWVKIYVSETLLPHIRVGEKVKIIPDGSDTSLPGKVSWISPKAEFTPKTILTPETRTSLVYAVKIRIPNKEGILKQGMPVEIHLQGS